MLDNFLALIQNYFTLNQYSHLEWHSFCYNRIKKLPCIQFTSDLDNWSIVKEKTMINNDFKMALYIMNLMTVALNFWQHVWNGVLASNLFICLPKYPSVFEPRKIVWLCLVFLWFPIRWHRWQVSYASG